MGGCRRPWGAVGTVGSRGGPWGAVGGRGGPWKAVGGSGGLWGAMGGRGGQAVSVRPPFLGTFLHYTASFLPR